MKIDKDKILENKVLIAGFAFALILSSVSGVLITKKISTTPRPDILKLRSSSFDKIKTWKQDTQKETLSAFSKSCERILKKDPTANFGVGDIAGKVEDWQNVCNNLRSKLFYTNEEAQKFFEDNFSIYEVWGKNKREGLFTGYYEPTLHGSLTKHGKYNVPIYKRPDSLIKVDLGDFLPKYKGEKITGMVDGTKLVPYHKRAAIEDGALKNKELEIVWVDNAVDAFFLHIQGSGRVELDTGDVLRVGYADQNGHAYRAIGRDLIQMGAVKREDMSMQAIRKWLEENPKEAVDVMNINESYIFFHELMVDGEGPLGAEGISLTPERSMAVDRKQIPYGVPIWLDAEDPEYILKENIASDIKDDAKENLPRLQRLMVAQDTGGAIKGAVRGDFFWGAGKKAADNAGVMKSKGRMWLLLPKTIKVSDKKLKKRIRLW